MRQVSTPIILNVVVQRTSTHTAEGHTGIRILCNHYSELQTTTVHTE